MEKSESPSDTVLVLDTSAIINLIATREVEHILRAIPDNPGITFQVREELRLGAQSGHEESQQLQILINMGLIQEVQMTPACLPVYRNLVEGAARETLDDGEASCIAYAEIHGAKVVMDERKATRLVGVLFREIQLMSTVELLFDQTVRSALGPSRHSDAVYNALKDARMFVSISFETKVVELIGHERAAACVSLPKRLRPLS
ncbi:MAG: hypothetical protein OXM02_00990 [Bacteroidota bacterium]|nr:hypothetical protein [Bacteroidota bacterium]